MKKNKNFGLIFTIVAFLLAGCDFFEHAAADEKLQLLSLTRVEPPKLASLNTFDDPGKNAIDSLKNYENFVMLDEEESSITLEAIVQNDDRVSFIDIVMFIPYLNTDIVFNEGYGDFRCSSTTMRSGDTWITKIAMKLDIDYSSARDGEFEIKEVKFLGNNASNRLAYINGRESCTLNYHIHDYNQVVEKHLATCIEDGYELKKCSGCQQERTEQLEAAHSYTEGICDSCGELKEAVDLQFEHILDTDSYKVIGLGSCRDPNIKIPERFLNKPVTEIADNAFSGCSNIIRFVIPSTVTTIGSCAFYGCSSLKKITIPDFVTSLKTGTFGSCSNLETVLLPNGLNELNSSVFRSCSSLKAIDIPESVTYIGSNAFTESGLETLMIPKNVAYLGDYALSRCTNLQSVKTPASLSTINMGVFEGCTSLASVELSEGTKRICLAAFNECFLLPEVVIPKSCESLEEHSFNSCTSLSLVTIQSPSTRISPFAFSGCVNLTVINCMFSLSEMPNGSTYTLSDCDAEFHYMPPEE